MPDVGELLGEDDGELLGVETGELSDLEIDGDAVLGEVVGELLLG
ncbi:hypothetical protein [Sulfobacillus thermosulfidooxidans]|nr:hypothetical protein [Sulfobacillus thermosulfidooxidans]